MLDISVFLNYWPYFAKGFWLTIQISLCSAVLGFLIAFPMALMRVSHVRVLRVLSAFYIEVLRNVPFIILVFLFFYGLPFAGVRLPERVAGTIALSLFVSAYYAEILRGAMASIPRGQVEAARAAGFTYPQILRDIVVPQMWKFALPPMAGTTTMTVKESSILSTITVAELTYQGLIVQGMTFAPFEVFFAAAALYWMFTALLSWMFLVVERRLGIVQNHGTSQSKIARRFLSLDHRTS
jgi:polar amino acid transport system permease protein/putative glutamine transport system permease protein